jgi:hypothetical protein
VVAVEVEILQLVPLALVALGDCMAVVVEAVVAVPRPAMAEVAVLGLS